MFELFAILLRRSRPVDALHRMIRYAETYESLPAMKTLAAHLEQNDKPDEALEWRKWIHHKEGCADSRSALEECLLDVLCLEARREVEVLTGLTTRKSDGDSRLVLKQALLDLQACLPARDRKQIEAARARVKQAVFDGL